MKSCTFFGHKFTPVQIKPILYNKIIELIRDENVKNFYIGFVAVSTPFSAT